jgi:hypothetical protein
VVGVIFIPAFIFEALLVFSPACRMDLVLHSA